MYCAYARRDNLTSDCLTSPGHGVVELLSRYKGDVKYEMESTLYNIVQHCTTLYNIVQHCTWGILLCPRSISLVLVKYLLISLTIFLSLRLPLRHRYLIRMEVASSRPDHLATLSAAKTSEHSLLVKSHFLWLSGRCRQCYTDFLLQCAAISKLTTLTV